MQGHEALRGCLRSNAIAREMLLSLAGKRLKSMAHVGLTERLQESVLSMAADLGKGWGGCATASGLCVLLLHTCMPDVETFPGPHSALLLQMRGPRVSLTAISPRMHVWAHARMQVSS